VAEAFGDRHHRLTGRQQHTRIVVPQVVAGGPLRQPSALGRRREQRPVVLAAVDMSGAGREQRPIVSRQAYLDAIAGGDPLAEVTEPRLTRVTGRVRTW
jgi:hypothetical protein